MAITYKVHPAIGIARVGNSPEFYIGPERPFEAPNPDGFKDSLCRIKRQAARFRVFRHDDVAGTAQDVTAEASITWTVHVANRKSSQFSVGGTVIDPGVKTLSGLGASVPLNGSVTFDSEIIAVTLGEARTDDEGRLIFLGGFGIAGRKSAGAGSLMSTSSMGWYDDTSDGRIDAQVTIDGGTHTAVSAWVVAAPPKFAPTLDNVVTLYDAAYERARASGNLPPAQATAPTSYRDHIRIILERARQIRWVRSLPSPEPHGWSNLGDFSTFTPARRLQIFERLRVPLGETPPATGDPLLRDMPLLSGQPRLTPAQYQRMRDFAEPTFAADSLDAPSAPTITAEGLDRAGLESCVGATFAPGVEIGGSGTENPFVFPGQFLSDDPFRLDPSGRVPGSLTAKMPVPWHGDFYLACGGWWPINRPTTVRSSTGDAVEWDRNVDIGDIPGTWHHAAFLVEDPMSGEVREEGSCQPLTLPWLTTLLRVFWVDLWRLRIPDLVSDPAPIDWGRLRQFLSRRINVRAAAPPDELSALVGNLERLSKAELRSALIDVRGKKARLDAAERLIEERLGPRRQ
jgi:hypothetical protein